VPTWGHSWVLPDFKKETIFAFCNALICMLLLSLKQPTVQFVFVSFPHDTRWVPVRFPMTEIEDRLYENKMLAETELSILKMPNKILCSARHSLDTLQKSEVFTNFCSVIGRHIIYGVQLFLCPMIEFSVSSTKALAANL